MLSNSLGEDSCFGDSGGPLAILSGNGDDLQVGVSHGVMVAPGQTSQECMPEL